MSTEQATAYKRQRGLCLQSRCGRSKHLYERVFCVCATASEIAALNAVEDTP